MFPTPIRELVLNGNNIASLEKDIFISRGQTELEHLRLSSCGLERIELGAFNGLTQLPHLSMSFNQISEIIPRTFKKMSRLE
jgi:Leucine-rich repeat (LRR) protein